MDVCFFAFCMFAFVAPKSDVCNEVTLLLLLLSLAAEVCDLDVLIDSPL